MQVTGQMCSNQTHILLVQPLDVFKDLYLSTAHGICQSIFNSLDIFKGDPKGEISTAQLLSLEFRVFLAKISLIANGHFSKLYLHLPNNM